MTGRFVNEVCLGDTNGAAAPTEDGWLTITHIGTAGLMFLDSIEVDELRHPIMIRTPAGWHPTLKVRGTFSRRPRTTH